MVLIYLEESKAEPMISDTTAIIEMPFGKTQPIDFKMLWDYFTKNPEIVSICKSIVEDIMSDGGRFESLDKKEDTSRNKKIRAQKFWEENRMKELLTSLLFDVLVTGDGFLYKTKLTETEVKNAISKIVKKQPFEMKAEMTELLYSQIVEEMKQTGENIYQTKELRLVPASTMKIHYDIHGKVKKYTQRVGIMTEDFSPDEIIHFSFMRINGEVYGFTPLRSVMKELDILSNIKDYEKYFFEKGGVPNYMFILKNETPESPTYKNFKKELLTFAINANKWKSMVLTGDATVEELNRLDKDMEFQELSRFVTQIIVMAWGIPSSRLSDVLVSKGLRASQVSTEGYYRQISHYQDMLEDMINTQILKEFGVKWRFNRTYKQDEVREVQIKMMNADAMTKRQSILQGYKKKLTLDQVLRELDLNEDNIEDGMIELMNPLDRQGFMPNRKLMPQSSETIAQNADKEDAARESDLTQKAESVLNVNWNTFLSYVQHLDENEIFIKKGGMFYEFTIMSGNKTIKSYVLKPKDEDGERKLFEKLATKKIIELEEPLKESEIKSGYVFEMEWEAFLEFAKHTEVLNIFVEEHGNNYKFSIFDGMTQITTTMPKPKNELEQIKLREKFFGKILLMNNKMLKVRE